MLPVVVVALAIVAATAGVYTAVPHKADAQSLMVSALSTRLVEVHTTSPVSARVALGSQQATPQLQDAAFGAALGNTAATPALDAFGRN